MGLEAGADHDHDIRNGQGDMAQKNGMETSTNSGPVEENQHRSSDDQPRNGYRREEEKLQELPATEIIAIQAERAESPNNGCNDGVDERNRNAIEASCHQFL